MDHIRCGLLASIGERVLKALRRPVVSVISTGSELTEPGENLSPGKIYASAGYMLSAAAESRGIEVKGPYLCGDEADEAQRLIEEAAASSDLIITTGAVSVGEKGFYPLIDERDGSGNIVPRSRHTAWNAYHGLMPQGKDNPQFIGQSLCGSCKL